MERVSISAVLAMSLSVPAAGIEPGDFDGDGRLSIADVVLRMNEEPIADG